MQIILLEKVANLGQLGDIVKVRDGYARNYLIPQKIARRATSQTIADFEAKRAELEKAQAEKLGAAQAEADKLADMVLGITAKAGVDGRLFGSITNGDVAEALQALDIAVHKSQVRMPEGPLKAIGEHQIKVVFHTDVSVELAVNVTPEQ